eukprot:6212252-Pleurochrysis_carterae.AAC.1
MRQGHCILSVTGTDGDARRCTSASTRAVCAQPRCEGRARCPPRSSAGAALVCESSDLFKGALQHLRMKHTPSELQRASTREARLRTERKAVRTMVCVCTAAAHTRTRHTLDQLMAGRKTCLQATRNVNSPSEGGVDGRNEEREAYCGEVTVRSCASGKLRERHEHVLQRAQKPSPPPRGRVERGRARTALMSLKETSRSAPSFWPERSTCV